MADKADAMTNDQYHLVNQLAHHDAAITGLTSRMTGVEASLTHVTERVGQLDNKVSAGFSSLESLVRESKASQGPAMPDVLRMLVTGGALVAMSAGAITVLVTSFVNPDLAALDHKTTAIKESLSTVKEVQGARITRLERELSDHVDAPGHRGSVAVQEAHEQRLDRLETITDRQAVGRWATDVRGQ